MNFISWIGIIILMAATLLDILICDGVKEEVKPQVYFLGGLIWIIGLYL